MIGIWMLSALAVSLGLAMVGALLSPLTKFFSAPRRWLWLLLMLASATIPLLSSIVPKQTAVVERQPTAIVQAAQPAVLAPVPASRIDQLILVLWGTASVAILGMLALTHRRALRQLASWETRAVFGETVWISQNYGPAAVGLVRARVVLPEWVFTLSPEEQQLVLLHEQQHIRAGDQHVLLAGIALVVMLPWNLPLWWQLQRMRIAMELDCDARVAPTEAERPLYGRMLLRASKQQGSYHTALAFAQTPSALVERMSALLDAQKPSRKKVLLRALAGTLCVWLISSLPIPNVAPALAKVFPASATVEIPQVKSEPNALSLAPSIPAKPVDAPRSKARAVKPIHRPANDTTPPAATTQTSSTDSLAAASASLKAIEGAQDSTRVVPAAAHLSVRGTPDTVRIATRGFGGRGGMTAARRIAPDSSVVSSDARNSDLGAAQTSIATGHGTRGGRLDDTLSSNSTGVRGSRPQGVYDSLGRLIRRGGGGRGGGR